MRDAPLVLLAALLAACVAGRTRPLPEALADRAEVPGLPRARFWGDEPPDWFRENLALMREQLNAHYTPEEMALPSNYLVLSGGSDDGAFGAGFLCGWTRSGERPPFLIVTGVSTGALIAPFAFAGPAFDEDLREIFQNLSRERIVQERSVLEVPFRSSIVGNHPLRELVEEYVDESLMDAIADRYDEGRRLYVGTTHLDAERPVIWDVSYLAASGHPDALHLIHDVLLASAAIPVVFPPIEIEVEADGQRYRELHVDGGATTQLFLYPAALDWRSAAESLLLDGRHRLYILRNGQIDPIYETVHADIPTIAQRTIHSLIRTQSLGDLYRLYLGARRDGIEYRLAHVPATFDPSRHGQFDHDYMVELFDLAESLAAEGYDWKPLPPGLEAPLSITPSDPVDAPSGE